MSAWWIGNPALLLVMLVAVLLLTRVLRSALEVRRRLAGLAEHGGAPGTEAEELDELERTRELVSEVRAGLARYADGLSEMAARR